MNLQESKTHLKIHPRQVKKFAGPLPRACQIISNVLLKQIETAFRKKNEIEQQCLKFVLELLFLV